MRNTIFSAIVLLAGASAWAQNLNPTVEVTNVYAREATGIEKPSQLLEMPDSVLRFNLDMDYSVNATPYRGSYRLWYQSNVNNRRIDSTYPHRRWGGNVRCVKVQ